MTRDKQIEKMAKDISKKQQGGWRFVIDDYTTDVDNEKLAEHLYNADYRKASEVAREIFEEIDRMIYRLLNDRHYIVGDMCYEVEELKKKYTESEDTECSDIQ